MGIKVTGMDKLQRKLKQLGKPKNLTQATRSGLTKGARLARNVAKENVPVDEGDLKKSLTHKVSVKNGSGYAVAGSDGSYQKVDEDGNKKVPDNYDHLVEFGTVHSEAHPFYRPAEDAAKAALPAIMEAEYKKKIDELTG